MSVISSPSTTPASRATVDWSYRVACSEFELERHFEVRREVFVCEQAIFAASDRDARDVDPATLHAVGLADGGVVDGAVRLYPLDDDGVVWQGDRLAVRREHRHGLLGAGLVRFAVSTAGSLGGSRMVAMIQLPNVGFFRMLGWHENGAVALYHGVAHQPMEIPLRAAAGISRPGR